MPHYGKSGVSSGLVRLFHRTGHPQSLWLALLRSKQVGPADPSLTGLSQDDRSAILGSLADGDHNGSVPFFLFQK